MNEGELLYKAVCENPHDNTPRLILADYLQDNGQAKYAEYIRVEVTLAEKYPDKDLKEKPCCHKGMRETCPTCILYDRRINLLLSLKDAVFMKVPWSGESLHPLYLDRTNKGLWHTEVRRGMVDFISLPSYWWLHYADELTSRFPLTRVHLQNPIGFQVHAANNSKIEKFTAWDGGWSVCWAWKIRRDVDYLVTEEGFPNFKAMLEQEWPNINFTLYTPPADPVTPHEDIDQYDEDYVDDYNWEM